MYTAAYGGAGGKGNHFFLSNENRAPITATPGDRGQERVFQLELRTMAHAGLVLWTGLIDSLIDQKIIIIILLIY